MNRKLVFNYLGRIFIANGFLLLLPTIVSLIYREAKGFASFLSVAVLSFLLGLAFVKIFRIENDLIFAKEGFALVAVAWLSMSLIGALPFTISGEIPRYVDAFFEIVSGFTTTGSSILTNVEELSHGMLFWRSFSHWIGGMGVLVFVMAILPNLSGRSVHIMRAEMPGPTFGKLLPRYKDTAKILYLIYIALTVLETIFLLFGGMTLFESLVHSFGTAGTGGFGIKSDSITSYSPYIQWVITVFMLLFGVNFNLYFYFLVKKSIKAFKNTELFVYLGVVFAAIAGICINTYSIFENFGEALRHSAFQVASIVTTTGYATANFDLWPDFSKTVLLLLMFMGGCAGSTAGGLKVSRILLMAKMLGSEIRHMLHPRAVTTVKLDGRPVESPVLHSLGIYIVTYLFLFAFFLLIVSCEPFNFETSFTAVTACINNIGPGFGVVGPMGSFAQYSDFSKIVLSLAMLLGRLEIFPLLLTFLPQTWTKD